MHPTLAFLSWTPADLVHHLWQSSVIALALLLLMALCARLTARTRLTLGWMALAKFALPFGIFAALVTLLGGNPERWLVSRVFQVPFAFSTPEPSPAPLVSPAQASSTSKVESVSSIQTFPEFSSNASPSSRLLPAPSFAAIAAAVWLAGFAGLSGWWIIGGIRLRRRLLAGATDVSPEMARCIAVAAEKAGVNQIPRCLSVRHGNGPGLLGVWAPILTLPPGLEEKLTPAELESVLLHELIHLQRRDPFWLAVHVAAVSALWFNPVAWLLSRWIRLETEKACDERVLELTGRPDTYAQGILKVVHLALGLPEPRLLSVITPPVVSRVKNILRHGSRPDGRWLRTAALAFGAVLLSLGGHSGSLAITASAMAAAQSPSAPSNANPSLVDWPKYLTELADVTPNARSRTIISTAPGIFHFDGRDFTSSELLNELVQRIRGFNTSLGATLFVETSDSAKQQFEAIVAGLRKADLIVSNEVLDLGMESFVLLPPEAAAKPLPIQVLSILSKEAAAAEKKLESGAMVSPPPGLALKTARLAIPKTPFMRLVTLTTRHDKLEQQPKSRPDQILDLTAALQRTGLTGDVVLEVLVDDSGVVKNAYVASSTRTEFERPALTAVQNWTFTPGTRQGGEPVGTTTTVTIHVAPDVPRSDVQPRTTGNLTNAEQLDTAKVELARLRERYLDHHPVVQAQLARIRALETQTAATVVPPASPAVAGWDTLTKTPDGLGRLYISATGDTISAQTQLITQMPNGVRISRTNGPVAIDFTEQEIQTIIRRVADVYSLNVIIPNELQGKATIKQREVTWPQIFTAVLDPVGYAFTEEGNLVKIAPKIPPAPAVSSGQGFVVRPVAAAANPTPAALSERLTEAGPISNARSAVLIGGVLNSDGKTDTFVVGSSRNAVGSG